MQDGVSPMPLINVFTQSGATQVGDQNQQQLTTQEVTPSPKNYQDFLNLQPTQQSNAPLSTQMQQLSQLSSSTPERRRSITDFDNGIPQTLPDHSSQVLPISAEKTPLSATPFEISANLTNSAVNEQNEQMHSESNTLDQMNVQGQESFEHPTLQQETTGREMVPEGNSAVPDDAITDEIAVQEISGKKKKKSRRNRKNNDATPNTEELVAQTPSIAPENIADNTNTTITTSQQVTTQITTTSNNTNDNAMEQPQGTSENTTAEGFPNQNLTSGDVAVTEATQQDAVSSGKSKKKKNKKKDKKANEQNKADDELLDALQPPVVEQDNKTHVFPKPEGQALLSLTRTGKNRSECIFLRKRGIIKL